MLKSMPWWNQQIVMKGAEFSSLTRYQFNGTNLNDIWLSNASGYLFMLVNSSKDVIMSVRNKNDHAMASIEFLISFSRYMYGPSDFESEECKFGTLGSKWPQKSKMAAKTGEIC